MIRFRMCTSLFLLSAMLLSQAVALPATIAGSEHEPSSADSRLWRESFVDVTYDKTIKDNTIVYNYYVTNIGNVPIGTIIIGDDQSADGVGCQVPPENIDHLTTSIREWTARLEIQTENVNECITAHNLNYDYPLQPGQSLTISAHVKEEDLVFENLQWIAIFTGAPTRLNGEVRHAE